MFNQFPPELARLLNQERISEARKSMRGFCCAEDRREQPKTGHVPARSTTTESAACGC